MFCRYLRCYTMMLVKQASVTMASSSCRMLGYSWALASCLSSLFLSTRYNLTLASDPCNNNLKNVTPRKHLLTMLFDWWPSILFTWRLPVDMPEIWFSLWKSSILICKNNCRCLCCLWEKTKYKCWLLQFQYKRATLRI